MKRNERTTVAGLVAASVPVAAAPSVPELRKSGKEGTMSLKCKNGKTSMKFLEVKFQGRHASHPRWPPQEETQSKVCYQKSS